MATADIMMPSKDQTMYNPVHQGQPIPPLHKEEFDPEKHIVFKNYPKTLTMRELKFPEDQGVSPIAVSDPFQLFSPEAVQHMRKEILSDEVRKNHTYSSNLAHCQLRGFAAKCAPFVYDAWKSPKTLELISKIAGVDLVTAMDFEIAHINISMKSEKEKIEELEALADKKVTAADEGIAGCPWEDDKPIVDWHTDSYPFVCVTMLSDCTGMVGGETALRTGDGDILKVRGPQMGCAVVLQGRYIEHQALRALGATERITMVTSFRPRDPLLRDDTVLTTVRPISDLSELYYQFAEYRLEMLEHRLRDQQKKLRESMRAGKKFHTNAFKSFLKEHGEFTAHMNKEMVEESKVTAGSIDDSHLIDDDYTRQRKNNKRRRTGSS